MTQKDRRRLIVILNTGLMLYVTPENRKPFVEYLADGLEIESKDTFIKACLAD